MSSREDTKCGVDGDDTTRIIGRMEEPWWERAKRRMRQKKITQDRLKGPLGVKTRGGVGHYLSGRRMPSPEQLVALARELEWTVDQLLTGQNDPSPDDLALAWFINHLSPQERARIPALLNTLGKQKQLTHQKKLK